MTNDPEIYLFATEGGRQLCEAFQDAEAARQGLLPLRRRGIRVRPAFTKDQLKSAVRRFLDSRIG